MLEITFKTKEIKNVNEFGKCNKLHQEDVLNFLSTGNMMLESK
jgi:hypothetical protein